MSIMAIAAATHLEQSYLDCEKDSAGILLITTILTSQLI